MRVFWLLILLVSIGTSSAGDQMWLLDAAASSMNFESSKNTTIRETHSFSELSGHVSSDGDIVIQVDLMSVDTGIPIRDERMRNLLFKIGPAARVSAEVDMQAVAMLAEAEGVTLDLEATLSLNGKESPLPMRLDLTRLSDSQIQVVSEGLIDVAEYGYSTGIEALREIAGLQHISTDVPYQLTLRFEKTNP
jgi:polyisoprenoid-binding protein YceI